ncbi:fungal-specific transcription factor domain-containing protein [Auriculariales sp. MPI-PUGE-AT-0066]|nr:fungal-specific transcription factor domain-containing protein [Auriculariales sp. MPI-PUGE-AT-0066]
MVGTSSTSSCKPTHACDACRRRKSKGNGPESVDSVCTLCRNSRQACTYFYPAHRRWAPVAYVHNLEDRIEAAERVLQQRFPGVDFTSELGPVIPKDSWMRSKATPDTSRRNLTPPKHPFIPYGPRQPHLISEEYDEMSDDPEDLAAFTSLANQNGASSSLRKAPTTYAESSNASLLRLLRSKNTPLELPGFARHEFWNIPIFESIHPAQRPMCYFELPPPDLLANLIDIFFTTIAIYGPFLHRGLLEQQLADGLHYEDCRYTALLLLICANAARHSNDTRVLMSQDQRHSAGWHYYAQVEGLVTRTEPVLPDVLDLQIIMLAASYLTSTVTSSPLSRLLISHGLRLCQLVGAHRKCAYSATPNLMDELWKRVFWSLVAFDRFGSALTGQRCSILDEDSDVDFPMIVDDDCWDLADVENKYPQSHLQRVEQQRDMVFFVAYLKLTQITAYILRSLYSLSTFKFVKGVSSVAEIDSALNQWYEELTEHLHWDPHTDDIKRIAHSGLIHCLFYQAQMLLHRPFMFQSKLGLPSLTICTNAAQSHSRMLEVQARHSERLWLQVQIPVILQSGIVLMIDLWHKMRASNRPSDHPQFVEHWHNIAACINALTVLEKSWPRAGKFADVLRDLSNSDILQGDSSDASAPASTSSQKASLDQGTMVYGFDTLNLPIFSHLSSGP